MKVYYGKLATFRNAFLVYNPNAGRMRRNPGLAASLKEELQRQGHTVELSPTRAAGHATELAQAHRKAGADLIVVAGGDGTVNETLNGMVGSETPLAVVPGGTANVFCMETRIGGNAMRAARALQGWQPARVALGLVRNADGSARRYFLLMAGAGLDAHVVSVVSGNLKRRIGKGAYWIAGFQSVTRQLEEMDVRVEGQQRTSSFALLSRVRNYGGDLEIASEASLLRDQFELVAFEGSNPLRYLKYLTGVGVRHYRGMSGVFVTKTQNAWLAPHDGKPVYLQVDGELCGQLPVTVELVRSALTILLPADYLAKERARWTI